MASVEAHSFDPSRQSTLSNCLADDGRCIAIATILDFSTQILLGGTGRHEGSAFVVVDDLAIDVFECSIDGQPRSFCGTAQFFADAKTASNTSLSNGFSMIHGSNPR